MKITLPLLFPRIAGLWASALLAATTVVVADEEREKLLTEAVAARDALVVANFKKGVVLGCFIAEDGLAVLHILSIFEKPLGYSLADQTRLPKPTVRHLVPEHGIAILKFNYEPKVWLEPIREAIPLGLQVAILDPAGGALAAGPVRWKERGRASIYRRAVYQPHFMIGAGLRAGGSRPTPGAPIIDSAGRLRGTFHGASDLGFQKQLSANPTEAWFAEIDKARKAKEAIPLPLPDELDPFDPAGNHPKYLAALDSRHQGNHAQAIKFVKGALIKHPKSGLLHSLHFETANMADRIDELLGLAEATKPDANGTIAQQVGYLTFLAKACRRTGDHRGAGEALRQALEIAPEDNSEVRREYADWLQQDKNPREALKYLQEAVKNNPDHLPALGELRVQLEDLGLSKEANEIRDRILEVEDLYQSVPSSSLRPKRK